MRKFTHDERGVAHVLLIAIVLAVVAAVGFVGWTVASQNRENNSEATDQAFSEEKEATQAACQAQISDKEFCTFASLWSELGAYTAEIKTTGEGGSSTYTVKHDGNDGYHMVITISGNPFSEFISMSNTNYVKAFNESVWKKYVSDSPEVEDFARNLVAEFDESVPEAERLSYKKLGKEACGDRMCFKYQIIDPKNSDDEQLIWFDDKDYLVRRWTYEHEGITSEGTFSYGSVTISVPSPVEDGTTQDTEVPNFTDFFDNLLPEN